MSKLKGEGMKENQAIRHGECVLIPVSKTPKGNVEKAKKYIVGHSETGHHHILKSAVDFDIIMDKLEVYLLLNSEADLVHEKSVNRHKDIKVKPGIYKIGHKTEYNPFTKAIERVWD